MKKVQLTETVLRDANQSLMATRLPYADYEGILDEKEETYPDGTKVEAKE